ncbi:hypothetical protein ACJVDH_15500 [Pedobacter sp. AW1-32]|uniref:hypothetical protein n=1 Tax=Pedobacter sp. AW1-32 TaxID=3383026 RepID=UPI003FEEB23C
MRVTVSAVIETEFNRDPALAKIMNNRLQRAATELQNIHLVALSEIRSQNSELYLQLSYNAKYKIRYRILHPVSLHIENFISDRCSRLGYIVWKTKVTQPNNFSIHAG